MRRSGGTPASSPERHGRGTRGPEGPNGFLRVEPLHSCATIGLCGPRMARRAQTGPRTAILLASQPPSGGYTPEQDGRLSEWLCGALRGIRPHRGS